MYLPKNNELHLTAILRDISGDELTRPELEEFSKLLQLGGSKKYEHSLEQAYFELFSYNNLSDIAAAPILAEYYKLNTDSYWVIVEPASLLPYATSVVMMAHGDLQLSEAELHEVTDTLKAHFALDDMVLHVVNPNYWLLEIMKQPELKSYPPSIALGKNIADYLPQDNQQYWHKLFAEVQMLLERSETNQLRRGWGKPTVDAVWFWGNGELPKQKASVWMSIASDDALICALASYSGGDCQILKDETLPQMINSMEKLPALISKSHNDFEDVNTMAKLLTEHLKKKRFNSVSIVLSDMVEYTIKSSDVKPWWRIF